MIPTNLRKGDKKDRPIVAGEAMPNPTPVLLIIPVTNPKDVSASTLDARNRKNPKIENPNTKIRKQNIVIIFV